MGPWEQGPFCDRSFFLFVKRECAYGKIEIKRSLFYGYVTCQGFFAVGVSD